MTGEPELDGIEIDQQVMNLLIIMFRRCAEMGFEVPDNLPLDTPEHQRMAVQHLGAVLHHLYRSDSRE